MELTMNERFRVLDLLPQEGKIVLMERVRELRSKLIPSEIEEKELAIRQEGNQIFCNNWNVVKEIPMGETIIDFLTTKFKQLEAEEKITERDISLYKKFVN